MMDEFYEVTKAYKDKQVELDNLIFNVLGPKIAKKLGVDKKKIKEMVYDIKIRDDIKAPASYDLLKKKNKRKQKGQVCKNG